MMLEILVGGLTWALACQAVVAAPVIEKRNAIPSYVLEYAPLVYLHSQDPYKPSDIGAQISNTRPKVNFKEVSQQQYTLNDLDQLNSLGGSNVYLTSTVDITTNPAYLKGVTPDPTGKINSAVPCVIITTDHGKGLVDAFYMYFYAYNWGGMVLNILNLGNHVGDWEHNMIRFQDGKPTYVWYSQHANGQAFKYSVLEKIGNRPVTYSANGSHANYAIKGDHDHTIPNLNLPIKGILTDRTDAGILWDPVLSAYSYSYSNSTGVPTFTPYDSASPTGFLYFKGHWGDQEYPTSDKRQAKLFDQAKYASGPTGPLDKQLNRTNVCPDNGLQCILRSALSARSED